VVPPNFWCTDFVRPLEFVTRETLPRLTPRVRLLSEGVGVQSHARCALYKWADKVGAPEVIYIGYFYLVGFFFFSGNFFRQLFRFFFFELLGVLGGWYGPITC
jgi:hypothetical protein